MEENHVNLVRRSSGGGTVYQDLGNTNFTFVAKEKDMELGVNFRTVLQALQTLGIDAVCLLILCILSSLSVPSRASHFRYARVGTILKWTDEKSAAVHSSMPLATACIMEHFLQV